MWNRAWHSVRWCLLLLVLTAAATAGAQQTGTVTGTVMERGSDRPIDAAQLGGMVGAWAWITVSRRQAHTRRTRPSTGNWEREQQNIRREDEMVDRILAKVHDQGINSLTWWEKRCLRRATERQREREKQKEEQLRRVSRW